MPTKRRGNNTEVTLDTTYKEGGKTITRYAVSKIEIALHTLLFL